MANNCYKITVTATIVRTDYYTDTVIPEEISEQALLDKVAIAVGADSKDIKSFHIESVESINP
jgi:hypothetical protein